jgi:hypothetical protein
LVYSNRLVENDLNKLDFRGWRKILGGGDAWELILKEVRFLHIYCRAGRKESGFVTHLHVHAEHFENSKIKRG